MHLHSQNTCCTHTIDNIYHCIYICHTHFYSHEHKTILMRRFGLLTTQGCSVYTAFGYNEWNYVLAMWRVVRKLPLLQLPFLHFSNKASSKVWIICLNNPILLIREPHAAPSVQNKDIKTQKMFMFVDEQDSGPDIAGLQTACSKYDVKGQKSKW